MTPVFFFLLSFTFFLPDTTVHFTFFLLFFNLTLTVFPTVTVTDFLLSFTFFLAASTFCGIIVNASTNTSKTASFRLIFLISYPSMCNQTISSFYSPNSKFLSTDALVIVTSAAVTIPESKDTFISYSPGST